MSFTEKVSQAVQMLQQKKLEEQRQLEEKECLRQAAVQKRKNLYIERVVACGLPEDSIAWENDPGENEQLRFSIAHPGLPLTRFRTSYSLTWYTVGRWGWGKEDIVFDAGPGGRDKVLRQDELEPFLINRAAQYALKQEDLVYIVDLDDEDLSPIDRHLYVLVGDGAILDIALFSVEEIEEARDTSCDDTPWQWSGALTYRQFDELRDRYGIRETDPEIAAKAIARKLKSATEGEI